MSERTDTFIIQRREEWGVGAWNNLEVFSAADEQIARAKAKELWRGAGLTCEYRIIQRTIETGVTVKSDLELCIWA